MVTWQVCPVNGKTGKQHSPGFSCVCASGSAGVFKIHLTVLLATCKSHLWSIRIYNQPLLHPYCAINSCGWSHCGLGGLFFCVKLFHVYFAQSCLSRWSVWVMPLKSDSKESWGEGHNSCHCSTSRTLLADIARKTSPLESCSTLEKKTDVLSQIEGVCAAPLWPWLLTAAHVALVAVAPGHSEWWQAWFTPPASLCADIWDSWGGDR